MTDELYSPRQKTDLAFEQQDADRGSGPDTVDYFYVRDVTCKSLSDRIYRWKQSTGRNPGSIRISRYLFGKLADDARSIDSQSFNRKNMTFQGIPLKVGQTLFNLDLMP